MRTAIVNSKELGTNCWLAVRFTGGVCLRCEHCTYPEKVKCRAWSKGVNGDVLEADDFKRIELMS